MTSPDQQQEQATWESYSDNFPRHVLGVARYLQTQTMHVLERDYGHRHLKLSFEPYITLIGHQAIRPGDLAQALHISKQACNQAINQIEKAGYIKRVSDPHDGRAKQLMLSSAGCKLRDDGLTVIADIEKQLLEIAGAAAMNEASKAMAKLYHQLPLPGSGGTVSPSPRLSLGGTLPRIADYVVEQLMHLTQARGHRQLKLSFGQVLTLIGPGGGRIQQIAELQQVSKQAISAIASELESIGYLYKDPDPMDARQSVLRFTADGRKLIRDSVASVADLDQSFAQLIGKKHFGRLAKVFARIYKALELEQEVFKAQETDLQQLARQLQMQLGSKGSQALAGLLMNQHPDTRYQYGK